MRLLNSFLAVTFLFVFSKAWASAGGVSGGGGFVIDPLSPASPQELAYTKHLIHQSTHDLEDFILWKKNKWRHQGVPFEMKAIYAKLFENPKRNLLTVADHVDIHIEESGPCLTFDGLPVDGSINSKPGTVCVSAKTFSEKVRYEDTSRQAIALSVHELSEIVGLNEEEATQLQIEILKDLQCLFELQI